MSWFTSIMMFLIIWWLVLFTVLPWGTQATYDSDLGREPGAPRRPRLWLKVGVTTLVTVVLWSLAYFFIQSGWVSLR